MEANLGAATSRDYVEPAAIGYGEERSLARARAESLCGEFVSL